MSEASENNAFALVTISFRSYEKQRDLVNRAADNAGMTPSDYMREVMTADACRRLNEPMPILPPIIRGRGSSLVAQAAAKMGMTREQFDRRAAHLYAAQMLGLVVTQTAPISERPAASKSGQHRISSRPPAMSGGSKR